jgi:ABC-2 type transport system ATP-binding protein
MISIQNLTRKYGHKVAVDDVSLEIAKGEIVGLLGHNGAGKTTMMKVLTGFLEPTAGTATIGGIDVANDRIGVQRQIGYLPENAPLYREMLVQEYLLLVARLRGIAGSEQNEAVLDAATATGLLDHLVTPIAHLSKGYRQRVGLAQAIVHKPAVLILDEPTNGLDPTQILSIRKLITDLGKQSTIILSTHILQEIEAVCDRVVVLIDGRLAADSPLNELLSSRRVSLSVNAKGKDVEATLAGIETVQQVESAGPDVDNPGFTRWRAVCVGEDNPIPGIVAALSKRNWSIATISREQKALQQVFHELQTQVAQGQGSLE